jgi:hypothetical protein
MDRQGLQAWHVREVDAGAPVQMGAEIKRRCVSLGLPMGSRRWG